jgi:hypothetical protein
MSRFKKLVAIVLAVGLVFLGGLSAYAAKSTISLNSPVSFPVDI